MKPLNNRELSKRVWQFLLIFLALAIVPVALIFFSYYKVPDEISKTNDVLLTKYSNFEHSQKIIAEKMKEIDSNITVYATSDTEDPELLGAGIVAGLADLAKMDTSVKIVQLTSKGYSNHYTHVKSLVKAKARVVELESANRDLKLENKELRDASNRDPMNTRMLPENQ